jgi:tRNA(fMet)-specific endonuclease VapC
MACLDTTYLVDVMGRNGRKRQEAALRAAALIRGRGDSIVTSLFSLAELYVGVELSAHPVRERQLVDDFIECFALLNFDDHAALHYARIQAWLQRRGMPIGQMDALIAAVASANGHSIITRNVKHFAEVPWITVETY